jgi:putative redox protein
MPNDLLAATLTWTDDLVFTGGSPGGPTVTVDGDGTRGPSPMVALLLAAAGCTGADVVSILRKMRIDLRVCHIEITGTRRGEEPRRYVALHLRYHLAGAGLDEARARRAVELSLEKYCSVMHSLAPDIRVTHDIALG